MNFSELKLARLTFVSILAGVAMVGGCELMPAETCKYYDTKTQSCADPNAYQRSQEPNRYKRRW